MENYLAHQLNTLNLLSHINVEDYDYEKVGSYVIKKVEAGELVDLGDARFTSEKGEQDDLAVTDVFRISLEGYYYYGVIQFIGCYGAIGGYRLLVFDENYQKSRPIICEHKGLGKLFDYCEDYMGVFFVHPNEGTPVEHLMSLLEIAEELEDAAYGYFDFEDEVNHTKVVVGEDDVCIYSDSEPNEEEREAFEEVVADMIILDNIINNPKPEDFEVVMDLIDEYEAHEIYDYEGIKPICGCVVSKFAEMIEEEADDPAFAYDFAFSSFADDLENIDLFEDEVVEHLFYINTYLQVCFMTTEEVKTLAEAMKTYLKWYYEIELVQADKQVA